MPRARRQLVAAALFAGCALILTLAVAMSDPPAQGRPAEPAPAGDRPVAVVLPAPDRAEPKHRLPGVKVERQPAKPDPVRVKASPGKRLLYTTYFYTAGEAVVHGFEPQTSVRIVSLAKGATVWKGTVGRGEAKLVSTGQGAFAFMSDKKASFLVGTPSSCTAVGYWVRDREGSFRSRHLLTHLPSSAHSPAVRVIVWAWETTRVRIKDRTSGALIHEGTIAAEDHFELKGPQLGPLSSHVLEITADKRAASVQVYYDEGFFVPSSEGRGAGKRFQTYLGTITNGKNDLSLFAYEQTAQVKVTDIKSGEEVWSGALQPGGIQTLSLADRYLRVTSDVEISVAVAPFEHYAGSYAEHHFAAGQEGTGIDSHFLLTTPRELWIFSYYDQNRISVTDARSGKAVWSGTLQAGQVMGLTPGHGYYRVRSRKGSSVMGGALACGAEYSPAGGMFEVDEALMKVVMQIQEQRRQQAAAQGRTATADELAAPLAAPELEQAVRAVRSTTGQKSISPAETRERLRKMKTY